MFHGIAKKWDSDGDWRAETDLIGRDRIDSRLSILGVLRVLTKGITFDLIEEATNISFQHNNTFFKKFNRWFRNEYGSKYVKMPKTPAEIDHVVDHYTRKGVPGCSGSIDCVHVGWDLCPAGNRSDCKGKEGYPTLAFQAVTSHTKRILGHTDAFFGTWNDKTISKFDINVQKVKNEEPYTTFKWSYYTDNGEECEEEGLFFICDGGYCRWNILMPPYKHQIEGTAEANWSHHIESIRKDVECTFGILKKRFSFLKNKIRLHDIEDIDNAFAVCATVHNMLHEWDGLDDWENVEEQTISLGQPGEYIQMRDRSSTNVIYQDLRGSGQDDDETDREIDELTEEGLY
jgi:hypothetical protein